MFMCAYANETNVFFFHRIEYILLFSIFSFYWCCCYSISFISELLFSLIPNVKCFCCCWLPVVAFEQIKLHLLLTWYARTPTDAGYQSVYYYPLNISLHSLLFPFFLVFSLLDLKKKKIEQKIVSSCLCYVLRVRIVTYCVLR